MNKLLKSKKVSISIAIVVILVLAGIVIGAAIKGKKDKEQEIIVYDTDKDTVEEKADKGLKESESEDGPAFDEDNMINFDAGTSY